MSSTSKYVAKSFFWGGTAKVLDAGVKFVSLPLLLSYFGKDNFGLISLAISINAYLSLLDLGINTGAVKYFSEWIASERFDLLDSVARTSISFYGIIGVVNAIVLVIIAFWGMNMFSITPTQVDILHNLFLILAVFAIVNWSTSVFNQLLMANEDIAYIQQMNIIRSVLGLILIFATIKLKLSMTSYFTYYTLVNSIVVLPYFLKAKKHKLISGYRPGLDWKSFGIIFKYSLAIIAMGIFSLSATKLRPIVLSIFSKDGIGILADYRIMETITLFIISIGGIFISIFLPKTSKLLLENDKEKVNKFAYDATLYTSVICIVLCIPFILNGHEIIEVYVGDKYVHLVNWLSLWVITILFYLHNSPVSSLVLSTGKTRMLVYSSAVSCIISLIINAAFCTRLGAGSAVLGYSFYILIQMSFYYFYFNKRVLGLDSFRVFRSFIQPVIIGFLCMWIVRYMHVTMNNLFLQIILKSVIWGAMFFVSLLITKVIPIEFFKVALKRQKA